MRIVLMTLLIFIISFSVNLCSYAQSFRDVPTDYWGKEHIEYLKAKGYLKGYKDEWFGTNDDLTRAQAAVFLVHALKLPVNKDAASCYKDVPSHHPAMKEICTAKDHQLLHGNNHGLFRPNDSLTRAEMAAILSRAYSLSSSDAYKVEFLDVSPSYWANGDIQSLIYNNVATGYPNRTFQPEKRMTRAEFAVLLARTIEPSFQMKPIDWTEYFPIKNRFEYTTKDTNDGLNVYRNLGSIELDKQMLYKQHYVRFVDGKELGDNVDRYYEISKDGDLRFVGSAMHGEKMERFVSDTLLFPGKFHVHQMYNLGYANYSVHRLIAKGFEDVYAGGMLFRNCLVTEETYDFGDGSSMTYLNYYAPHVGLVKQHSNDNENVTEEFVRRGVDLPGHID